MANIITENINGIEFQELRDYMERMVYESMKALDPHDSDYHDWYEACTMEDYFQEWMEIWNDEDVKVGDGIDTIIGHKFVLNDGTRADFERAFNDAKSNAIDEYIESIQDDISDYAEECDFEKRICLDDEVINAEREEFPHCTDSELISSRIDDARSRLESEGYKQIAVDNGNLIEFDSPFAQDVYDKNTCHLTAEEIAKWFGATVMIHYHGSEPFDYEDIYFKKAKE